MSQEIVGVRRLYILFLLFAVAVINMIDRQLMGVVIEPIKREFHVSDAAMGLLTGLAFASVYCCCAIPIARYADRANRRNVIVAACAVWSLMTVVCGTVTGYWQLAFARMGVAIGESGSNAPSMSMLADLYPPKRRAKAIGVLMLAAPVGTLIGMTVGAYLTYYHGWRTMFFWLGMPGLVVSLLLWSTTGEPHRIHHAGDIRRHQAEHANQSTREVLRDAFRSRTFVTIVAAGSLLAFSGYAFGTWSTAFLVRAHGMTLRDAGVLMGLSAGPGAVIGSLSSGWLADRLSNRDVRWQLGVPIIGALLTFPFAIGFTMLPADQVVHLGAVRISAIALCILAMSVFAMWWMAPSYAAITQLFPSDRRATIVSIYNFGILAVGAGLGPIVVGALNDVLTKHLGTDSLGAALALASSANVAAAVLLATSLNGFLRAIRTPDPSADSANSTGANRAATSRA
ncbi:MFS transporter [Paraburkholderia sp.]|uniref:spinster family MFS transporter n=1 Tax=Paraburkholderia sp. TaxID=1926495 RepID=UPI002390F4A3|nr:MFS transporter [Paraburkholderia sp.]MDE1179326.1 MFS transporter [Paraburkholderia sp.]